MDNCFIGCCKKDKNLIIFVIMEYIYGRYLNIYYKENVYGG